MNISLSILEYEQNLSSNINTIKAILSTGLVDELHVDVMRDPFVQGRNTFSKENLRLVCEEFNGQVGLDFHLMVRNPRSFIDRDLDFFIGSRASITMHREAYRYSLGEYNSKEYDLYALSTGDGELDDNLRRADRALCMVVKWTLAEIKRLGYISGLALESGTSLEGVSGSMAKLADRILLMGVSSGAGGQVYRTEVNRKIKETKCKYSVPVQVDGGVNDRTIAEILNSGADRIVVGSYITMATNPVERLEMLARFKIQH